jgi:hypothetical protein
MGGLVNPWSESMPSITISEETFARLQRNAKAFIETTPEPVIVRALNALEQLEGAAIAAPATPANGLFTDEKGTARIDPRALPNLTHTKVLRATLEGKVRPKAKWNTLVYDLVGIAFHHLGSFEKVQSISPANIVKGRKEDEGYHYLPEGDLSVQYQDANGACRSLIAMARELDLAVEVELMWREKEGAERRGETAVIRMNRRQKG